MNMNEKIKDLRLQRGLTLEQVGNYVGVGKSTVLKWENGCIQNMRRDKIAKLACILGTTPDFLVGLESCPDEWTKAFCESVEEQLLSSDPADIAESGVDYNRLCDVASGVNNLSLSEACNIADELGCSLDEMVGRQMVEYEVNSGLVGGPSAIRLTKEEEILIQKYRNNPQMQPAVNTLLGISSNNSLYELPVAARSGASEIIKPTHSKEERDSALNSELPGVSIPVKPKKF